MVNICIQLINLLSKKDKKLIIFLFLLFITNAFLGSLSVTSIIPFINTLIDHETPKIFMFDLFLSENGNVSLFKVAVFFLVMNFLSICSKYASIHFTNYFMYKKIESFSFHVHLHSKESYMLLINFQV